MSGSRAAGTRPAAALAAATLAGAAVMAVELSAVRLVAPWFGTSLPVWTNVIGVVLLGLSLGYLGGARLAVGRAPERSLGLVLLAGGALVAVCPALAGPVSALFLPDALPLHEAASVVAVGSLAASLLLFLPPSAVLGTVGPLAVELVQRARGGHAGTAGGQVLCASTLGSLVGTFGATHLAVPRIGLEATFLSAAAVLALAGAGVLLAARRPRRATVAACVAAAAWIAVAGALGGDPHREPRVGERLLVERESPYQRVRVVEVGEGAERLRLLQVNEAADSYQSVWQPEPGLLPEGFYYNDFVLPAWWEAAAGAPAGPWRTLVLGLGGGTAVRVLEGALPPGRALATVGVELDPVVVEVASAHLGLERGPDRAVHGGLDARVAVRAVDGPFDQVVLDCYANQVEIPPHLATLEFLRTVRGALRPGGWCTANVGGFGVDDPLVVAVAETLSAAFGEPVLALRVPKSRNVTLVARRDAAAPTPGADGWWIEDAVGRALLPAREVDGAWAVYEADAAPLTDDRTPIEFLQQRSLRTARERLAEGA